MDLNVEDGLSLDAKPGRKSSALVFANPFTTRTRSATTIYTQPGSFTGEEAIEAGDADKSQIKALTRSRSEDVGPRVRQEWGDELQPGLKESADLLRTSVTEYNKEATHQQWKDLLKINTDLTELGKLADGARKRKSKKMDGEESEDGLSKFSTVALEYSKMLDVVMNQSPEYAGLAWGAIRMLLVAHTNHSKLKNAVEHYIIQFGQDFGVVNHLMNSHPTQKMVEAVTEAYAAFAKFLAKAVSYYKESRMMSAIKAFGFPWETRFQSLVQKIEAAFKRIKDIASAGHFGVTVQTQQMIETIGTSQDNMRYEMHRNTIELREQLKVEMRDEVQNLFQAFDRNWISRFEQIMMKSIHNHATFDGDPDGNLISSGGTTAAIEYAGSRTESNAMPASFLAEYVTNPKRLKRFRDKVFVHLQKLDNDEINTNLRLRHTTTQDLQQIMGLLRDEKLRSWLQASTSSLVWVNTFKRTGPSDWATALSLRIVEYASKVDNMTVLYCLCGNHSTSSTVSTPTVTLQSLIIQIIEKHHKQFTRKVFPFTLEYFKDVQEDIQDLWDLFLKCCSEPKLPCIWLVLDQLDNLQSGEDYDYLLRALSQVVQDDSPVFKVFVSARTTGTPGTILEAADIDTSIPRVASITVPRTQSSMASAMLSKQKRPARLPDASPERPPAASKADIDALLQSSSEDDLSSGPGHANHGHLVESPTSISALKNRRLNELKQEDTDLETSDASMEFTRDDPFATSEEDESDGLARKHPHHSKDISEDDEEGFDFVKSIKPSKTDLLTSDSSEGDLDEGTSASRLKSRGRPAPSQGSVRITRHKNKSPFDTSDSEEI